LVVKPPKPVKVDKMVITLQNKKGGVGKSSLACLLALYWAEKGKETAIWDRDRQGSAEAFVAHIEHEKIEDYREGKEYDHILIDTPGGLQATEIKKLVKVSDLILIPFQLSPTDMRSTGETVRHLKDIDEINYRGEWQDLCVGDRIVTIPVSIGD